MPFVRKADSQGSQPPTDARKIFIGRTGELLFFVQNILKPEEPTHNIISIWGQGGVGKSTLLSRFIDEAHSAEFKDYCLMALVDERQTTPLSIMEKFADQLHLKGEFEKALRRYKEALRKQQTERETMQGVVLNRVPDFAGAAAEMVPFVGPLLREGAKATAGIYLDKRQKVQGHHDAEILEDPINELTRVFVDELNQLAESQVLLGSKRIKNLRVILFFDTFEQLATEAAPWLLNYFLPADIKGNIVLVIAGRDPIERSIPEDMKHWLPYCDNETIYWIPLNSFTEDETRVYLTKRNITDPERITTIWQLSQGLPLYLSLLTTNLQGKVDPTKDVVDNFLRWIPQQERVKRRLVLDAALLSKPFNQDDLEVFTYLSENERDSIYDWLIGQPFVRSNPQDGRYSYHELAQELFSRHLYQRSQKAYYTTRRALANHYQQLLEEIQAEGNEDSAMWSELALAQVHQLFLLPDEAAHIQAIKQILHIYKRTNKESEIIKVLHELSREQYLKQTTSNARRNIQMLLQLIGTDWWDNQGDLVAASSAASTLLEILTLTPSFPTELLVPIYYMQGWMRYRLEEHKQAIADFTRALELDPSYFAAYRALGIVSREFDDLQSSIDALNRALELDPMSANVYMNRGWTYHFSGETQLAIADFDHALELDPQVTDAYTGLGWVHFQLKEYKQALADFDHALKLDLKSRDAWHGRGWVHFQLKEYEQALADFDHFIEIYEKNPWVYLRRGMTYSYLKKYQQALADFDRALALDPKNRETYLQRGRTYLWLKDIKRGYADFSRGWEIDSTNVYCGWIAEWANMCQEKPDSRVPERLEAIAATDPMHYAAKVSRGSACWLQGDFEAAGAELEQALQLQPERWDAFFWRGMVCASLGQDEAAIAAVEKALALELPPVLLAPLSWFEQDKPDFYQKHVVPLMARYDLV